MKIETPTPASFASIEKMKAPGRIQSIIRFGNAKILFDVERAIAVQQSNITYYPDCVTTSQRRAISAFAGDYTMLQRSEARNFDFVLAQALIAVAMPLTHAAKVSPL